MDTSKSNTIISKRVLSVLPLASILVIAFLLTEFHPFTSDFKSFFTFFLSGWFLFTLYLSVKGKHLHERYMIFILSLIVILNGLYRREIFEAYFQIPIEYGACIIIVFYLLRISFPYIKKLSLWFLSHTQEPPDTDTNTPNNGASKMRYARHRFVHHTKSQGDFIGTVALIHSVNRHTLFIYLQYGNPIISNNQLQNRQHGNTLS